MRDGMASQDGQGQGENHNYNNTERPGEGKGRHEDNKPLDTEKGIGGGWILSALRTIYILKMSYEIGH